MSSDKSNDDENGEDHTNLNHEINLARQDWPALPRLLKYKNEQHYFNEPGKEVRVNALRELKFNKQCSNTKLIKTRLCKSLKNDMPCLYGHKCKFAHSLAELNYTPCLFGKNCYFIKYEDGKIVNVGTKMCNHLHPTETIDYFIERTGLDKFNTQHSSNEVHIKISKDLVLTAVDLAINSGKKFIKIEII
jgi:hypothetical protein